MDAGQELIEGALRIVDMHSAVRETECDECAGKEAGLLAEEVRVDEKLRADAPAVAVLSGLQVNDSAFASVNHDVQLPVEQLNLVLHEDFRARAMAGRLEEVRELRSARA